ncbi:hypothetical protein FRC04_000298 [Tulasnella sp. 424]|nr:hypothetical protein FRC04_000298 [Tulasnella sp. 424]KAG8982161.1 hypothetical protein FRC05_000303 [Tulasnella sp. 425]
MLGFLKASWDHLPKPPRLPPSLFSLKARRAWLNVRPEFTYGDERDKLQRQNTRRAQKQLAKDEAWARAHKKRQARADKKAKAAVQKAANARAKKAQKSGFKPLAESKQANLPSRSQSMRTPATVNGWAALQVSATPATTSKRPGVVRSPSAPVPRTAPKPVASGHGSRPGRPGMPAPRPTQQVVYRVQPRPAVAQPKRSATQPVPQQRVAVKQQPAPAKPVVVRSATMPVPKRRS